MAAPEYVPATPAQTVRKYASPPRRDGSWMPGRPGEITGVQPTGARLGSQGPDQGFVLRLARDFEGSLVLEAGEHEADAVAGCAAIALRRASLFGRAPLKHDLTLAFSIWGYLGQAPRELVDKRRALFEEVSHAHHYPERRAIVDMIPEATLRMVHTAVDPDAWRDNLGLS